ncbi:MAG: hypothetical protein CMO81_03040 [Waddliaceae bacterium]|nr:hypothetical protein [Waddliaceae bacterium]|tara:strand:+ start:261 stop:476 length:216 start_codon:yes stop_codon:yes gene_type:complete
MKIINTKDNLEDFQDNYIAIQLEKGEKICTEPGGFIAGRGVSLEDTSAQNGFWSSLSNSICGKKSFFYQYL